MRPQQNPNVQIDLNARGQISDREMQMLQKMLQQPQSNFLSPNLGLFGNTIGAQTHNPLKGQISDREMQMLRKAQQELYFRHLQQLSQQQMQNTKGQISDREMQYFRNQMGN